MGKEKLLIIGANGQIGTVLTAALREQYGKNRVIATDIRPSATQDGPFEILNILDKDRLLEVVKKYKVNQIYHLAAILSAKGEENPARTWDINMKSLFNVLEVAKSSKIHKVFFPSSIAVFGEATPQTDTPQATVLDPTTVYGISKAAGEHWCQYYHLKYGIDVRSLRFPGVIGHQTLPGGGTTDYAVDIFHKAVKGENYECFLRKNTRLPMIYMDDTIRATIELMEVPAKKIKTRTSYNLAAMSFTPYEITKEIRKHFPKFKVTYKPDSRQAIADSWTETIDDSEARKDWGWKEQYNLADMTSEMIFHLKKKYLVGLVSN